MIHRRMKQKNEFAPGFQAVANNLISAHYHTYVCDTRRYSCVTFPFLQMGIYCMYCPE